MAKKEFKGTLEKQLKIYSAAAAGVLALAPSTDAAIHYSGIQNLPVDSTHTQNIDLNGDTIVDFKFIYFAPPAPVRFIVDGGQNGGEVIAESLHGIPAAVKLASNYNIKGTLANAHYAWYGSYNALNGTVVATSFGNFNNSTGFLGVRFHTSACQGNNWNYGWIRYTGAGQFSPSITGTIVDWAYQSTCNTRIAAGAKASPTSIPTLNQWGMIVFMLLLGGLAARMLRKQEKEES